MAQIKISEMNETTSLNSSDLFVIAQDTGEGNYTNKKVKFGNVVPSGVVLQTDNQVINGIKTFTSTIQGNISGNAGTVTNGVYASGNQTISGVKTFTELPVLPSGVPTLDYQAVHKNYVDNKLSPSNSVSYGSFTNSNLTDGKLTVNHNLNRSPVVVVVKNNNGYRIIPDEEEFYSDDVVVIHLNSHAPISGTWSYFIIAGSLSIGGDMDLGQIYALNA